MPMSLKTTRRLIFSLMIMLACAGLAAAQDAGQVLRLSVGFNSLKNTLKAENKLSGERLAEVEQLAELVRQANTAGKYGEALKQMYHGIALMRGQAWTPERALASALTVKLDRALLEPGQAFTMRIGQLYALDEKLAGALTGSLALTPMTSAERLKEWNPLAGVSGDFSAQPLES